MPPNHKSVQPALHEKVEKSAPDCRLLFTHDIIDKLAVQYIMEQRGFLVAGVSESALKELIDTRIAVEALALNKSIQRKTAEWEERVVLALHRLSKTPRSLSKERFQENPEWEKFHRAFHMTLIENCGSRWIIAFCAQLHDQLYRYRRLAKTRYKSRNTLDEHKTIVDAMVNANRGEASSALHAHYTKTASIILATHAVASRESNTTGPPKKK